MRAVVQDRYGAADVLELRELPRPPVGDDDVLVRVHAAGVDPGVWHLMTGLPYLVRLGFGFRRPRNPVRGMDLAGRVEAVGANVTRFRVGDDVFGTCDGSFAEYVCTSEDKLAPKPGRLSFEQAAVVPVSACTALHAVRDQGLVGPGQHVLVIGAAGGVGSFAVQIAKALGAEVTGVCSTSKVELVRSLGADHVIDYTREELADRERGWDVIVDTAGNRPVALLRRVLTPEGTLVIVGGEGGGRWLGGTDRQMRAMALAPFVRQRLRTFISEESHEDLTYLAGLVEDGRLTPVIDRAYPLEEVADAVRHLEQGHARGKVVVTVRSEEGAGS